MGFLIDAHERNVYTDGMAKYSIGDLVLVQNGSKERVVMEIDGVLSKTVNGKITFYYETKEDPTMRTTDSEIIGKVVIQKPRTRIRRSKENIEPELPMESL